MGKESDSWLHQRLSPWQSPSLNCTGSMPDTVWQNCLPADTDHNTCMVSENVSLPGFPMSEFPRTNGWFYCLPRHRWALTPASNFAPKVFSAFPHGYGGEAKPNEVSTDQNRVLIFDQSGNHSNLIFSSLIGTFGQYPSSGYPKKPFGTCDFFAEEPAIKIDSINEAGAVISGGVDENREVGEGSEMHEDTEELNALLYSDDDDDDYDEETSTGHSPSAMTGHEKGEEVEGNAEEVASSGGPTKRKRWLDESSLMDTASSASKGSCKGEDDMESSCGHGMTEGGDMSLLSMNKRLKRERIWETVSILQSIIPGGKGKDAMLVVDEAIQYLNLVKLRVKTLGEIL